MRGGDEQVLKVCRASGLVRLGRVALDGTKIKANASKHKAMSYGRMRDQESLLRKEIQDLLRRAEATDRDEDRRYGADVQGNELPQEVARRETRLKKIREAKEALEEEAREQAVAEGENPKDAKPPDKAQHNFTDPESKIQKTRDGYLQGYNAQVAMDDLFQVIVAQHETAAATDVHQLEPAIASVEKVLKSRPKEVLGDAGYWSEQNVRVLTDRQIDPFLAPERQKHGDPIGRLPRGRPRADLTSRQRMARKLRTLKGRKTYSRRKEIVEPVIGQIKQARGFRQFLRRGLDRVGHEWGFICTAHNLLKLRTAMRMAGAA